VRVKQAWEKKEIHIGKREQFLQLVFGTARECRVLELGGSHSGHVWYLFGAANA
jgi:hypothetical protein